MLSPVPDELERFQKKKNHQNLTPEMMEAILDGSPHSQCLENAKNGGGRSARWSFSKFCQNRKPIFTFFTKIYFSEVWGQCMVRYCRTDLVWIQLNEHYTLTIFTFPTMSMFWQSCHWLCWQGGQKQGNRRQSTVASATHYLPCCSCQTFQDMQQHSLVGNPLVQFHSHLSPLTYLENKGLGLTSIIDDHLV